MMTAEELAAMDARMREAKRRQIEAGYAEGEYTIDWVRVAVAAAIIIALVLNINN